MIKFTIKFTIKFRDILYGYRIASSVFALIAQVFLAILSKLYAKIFIMIFWKVIIWGFGISIVV